jgi:hypothetical protein
MPTTASGWRRTRIKSWGKTLVMRESISLNERIQRLERQAGV